MSVVSVYRLNFIWIPALYLVSDIGQNTVKISQFQPNFRILGGGSCAHLPLLILAKFGRKQTYGVGTLAREISFEYVYFVVLPSRDFDI